MSNTTILELTTASTVTETTDYIPVVDTSDTTETSSGTTKKATVAKIAEAITSIDGVEIKGGSIASDTDVIEVLKKVYQVGCIYTSTVATSPATLFGFGTWEAFGEGTVLVGKASSGTFDTAGATGGSETVTLSVAQMPTHNHKANIGASVNVVNIANTMVTGTQDYTDSASVGMSTTGGSEAHTNLQPYIVVYFFRRTA